MSSAAFAATLGLPGAPADDLLAFNLVFGKTVSDISLNAIANLGFDKVRFMGPVRSGKRIRGRFRMLSAEEKRASQWQITYEVTVEIEDEEKPALIADWIGYMFI